MATDSKRKDQNLWGLVVLTGILSGLFFWTYQEISTDYLTAENSHRMVQSLLENQTHYVRAYAAQISDFKKNLAENDEKLALVQAENNELKEKLVMLDNVTELEQKVSQLEQANIQMKQDMELASASAKVREDELHAKVEELLGEQNFENVAEGRAVLAKYKMKIQEIKAKIKGFAIQSHNEEIAAMKAQDNARLLMGNNGYMVRNGQPAPANVAWPTDAPSSSKNVQIDVTFVK